jgi:hypothetical protein
MTQKSIKAALLLVLVVLVLSACTGNQTLPATPTIESTEVEGVVATSTQTPEPTPTVLPGRVLLISPAEGVPAGLQADLEAWSESAGLVFESAAEIQAGALSEQVKIVVALAPPENLNDLASAAPQTQFLVVTGADMPASGNISVIRQRLENQVFLAGYIGVLLSTDWRVAGLLPADGPLGDSLRDAFVNGGKYFCGVCAPGWPLRVYYPEVGVLPSASSGTDWLASAEDLFENKKAEVYFLSDEARQPEVIEYLRGREQLGRQVWVIGTQPPPSDLREQWAATVLFDLDQPLQQLWPDLLAGQGGAEVEAPLVLDGVNAQALPDSRIRLVENLLVEIEAGRIYPFSVPAE